MIHMSVTPNVTLAKNSSATRGLVAGTDPFSARRTVVAPNWCMCVDMIRTALAEPI